MSEYSFASHGRQNFDSYGWRLSTQKSVQVWGPSYEEREFTVVRPLPVPMRTGGLSPYRHNLDDPEGFGDWIRGYPTVTMGEGKQCVSYILHNSADPHRPSIEDLPSSILATAIQQAIDNDQGRSSWSNLIGNKNRRGTIGKPRTTYMMQAALFKRGDTWYTTNEHPPKGLDGNTLLFRMTDTAGEALLRECKQVRETRGPGNTFADVFTHGDPIALEQGKFAVFFREGEDPRESQNQVPASSLDPLTFGSSKAGGQKKGGGFVPYDCYLTDTLGSFQANMFGSGAWRDAALRSVKAWDSFLYFPTASEQARMIAGLFPPDAIMFAFSDHPDWITEDVRNRAVSAKTFGGAGWSGPQNQPPAGGQLMPPGHFANAPTGGGPVGAFPQGYQSQPQPQPQPQPQQPVDQASSVMQGWQGNAAGLFPAMGVGGPAPTGAPQPQQPPVHQQPLPGQMPQFSVPVDHNVPVPGGMPQGNMGVPGVGPFGAQPTYPGVQQPGQLSAPSQIPGGLSLPPAGQGQQDMSRGHRALDAARGAF